jgi:uncharacterized protein (TIGR03437 family)
MILVEGLPERVRRWEVRVEIVGFGVQPIYVGCPGDQRYAGLTQVNVPVPPGLEIGKNKVCLWHEGNLSNDFEIELVEGALW